MTAAEIARELYTNTLLSAPMVRGSSHLFRLSCLNYGADVVFSPGITDLSLLESTRKEENGHIVLYSEKNGHKNLVFKTCEAEKGKLVLQVVSNNSANAIKAFQVLEDVAVGVDLNCGCPESFACHRGGGSAIELETAVDIVKGLSRNTNKPVSVKFRIFQEDEQTIQFAKAIENAGASAITVHGRYKEQKHQGDVHYDKMKLVFEHVNCCKIGNGGVASKDDAITMREQTGCSAVMIASAALKNPSVFGNEMVKEIEVLAEMSKIGKLHHLDFSECKFTMQQVVQSVRSLSKAISQPFGQAATWEEVDPLIQSHL